MTTVRKAADPAELERRLRFWGAGDATADVCGRPVRGDRCFLLPSHPGDCKTPAEIIEHATISLDRDLDAALEARPDCVLSDTATDYGGLEDFKPTGSRFSPPLAAPILSNDQAVALTTITDHLTCGDNCVLQGPAGTGKTWLMRRIVAEVCDLDGRSVRTMFKRSREGIETDGSIVLTATTHKAAQVLTASVGMPVSTIHGVLGIRPHKDFSTGLETFKPIERPRLEGDEIVVVDEASMMNTELRDIALSVSEKYGVTFLFVGDAYQLPPVGETVSPVFCGDLPTANLTTIHRQKGGSPIIGLATEFRRAMDGETEVPEIAANAPGGEGVLSVLHDVWESDMILDFMTGLAFTKNPDRVRAIAWTNERVNGLNRMIRRAVIGPRADTERFIVDELVISGSAVTSFNAETKEEIIQISNDQLVRVLDVARTHHKILDIPGWRLTLEGAEEDVRVFVADDDKQAKVALDRYSKVPKAAAAKWKQAQSNMRAKPEDVRQLELEKKRAWALFFEVKSSLADIRYPYASTVHKAQGSTYGTAYIDVGNLVRNKDDAELLRLLYTAITRASRNVVVTGNTTRRFATEAAAPEVEMFEDLEAWRPPEGRSPEGEDRDLANYF